MICRRNLLLGGALFAAALKIPDVLARDRRLQIPLWPGPPPGGGGPGGALEISRKGAVSNISLPSLEIFAPEKPNGSAIIIAGGGGYKRIEEGKESILQHAGLPQGVSTLSSSPIACRSKAGSPVRWPRFSMHSVPSGSSAPALRNGRSIRTRSARLAFLRAAT